MVTNNMYYDMRVAQIKNNCPYMRKYWLVPWKLCVREGQIHSCICSTPQNCNYLYEQAVKEGLEEKIEYEKDSRD